MSDRPANPDEFPPPGGWQQPTPPPPGGWQPHSFALVTDRQIALADGSVATLRFG